MDQREPQASSCRPSTIAGMTPKKKQHNIWDRQIKSLLVFVACCEICNNAPATDHAHRLKRDLISWRTDQDRLEYFCVAKVCRRCHQDMDEHVGEDSHKRMFMIVSYVITERIHRWHAMTPELIEVAEYAQEYGWDPIRIYSVRR